MPFAPDAVSIDAAELTGVRPTRGTESRLSSRSARDFTTCILLAATYLLAGKLGLALAFINPSATAVWPPTGIALAAVLLFGPRVWPGIFLGAFLVNETTAGTAVTSLVIAAGNTLEAVLGGYLVSRFAGGRTVFDSGRHIFLFAVLAGLVSTGVGATIGVTTLSWFGLGEWSLYGPTWLTWWLGDAAGAMVVTPALLLWHANPRVRWSRRQWIELFAFGGVLTLVGWTVFVASADPLGFLCVPICVWAACRFGPREAATATCVLSLIAVWGTMQGLGTFGVHSINDVLLLLQSFMAVTSVIGLTAAAAVSGRRSAEETLRLANVALEHRAQTDAAERRRLEERLGQVHKMEAIGLLAGGVAHDFNNLLTAISGFTNLVLATVDETDPRRADLLEVQKAAQRAATLTKQLLAFSRRQVLQPRVIDVNELVAGIHTLLRRTIPEHVDLVLDLDPQVERVRADPGQFEQVVLNLAVNAGDAMPRGGRLRFATQTVDVDAAWARRYPPMPPGRYMRLTVSDTGTGISPETQSRIFEPFFTTKERSHGTGLGLSTVYGIVKQSGGFIWVSSRLQHGTTFEIYLPAVQDAAESAPLASRGRQAVGGSETILLAEDEGAVRRLARDVLRKNGYTVLEARDGEDALSIAQQHGRGIDLLLTDVVMPGLGGRDLADRLSSIRPRIHVLYSSGYAESITTGAGLTPDVPFLAKPYSSTELLDKVRETLDASGRL